MLSRYVDFRKVGEGGMGVVFRARDSRLDRRVAVKFLARHAMTGPDRLARLLREARLTASLDHPNVCTIYEIDDVQPGEEAHVEPALSLIPGTPYVVMEFAEGRTLEEILRERGSLTPREALDIAVQVIEGLSAAHDRGIVHRDIKPANTMVLPSGQVKILDFGLAASLPFAASDDTTTASMAVALTRTGQLLGTVAYVSPEQARGAEVDPRSDIFSLGTMLYEMVSGTRPFVGGSAIATLAKLLESDPEPLLRRSPDLDVRFAEAIHRCLRKDPEGRFADAAELERELRLIRQRMESGPPTADPGAAVRRPVPPDAAAAPPARLASPSRGVRELTRAAPSFRQVTFDGTATQAEISPDGAFLAWIDLVDSAEIVRVRDLAGERPIDLVRGRAIHTLTWEPNGARLLVTGEFEGKCATLILPRLSGTGRVLEYFPHAAWGPGAQEIVGAWAPSREIAIVDLRTGRTRSAPLTFPHRWILGIGWAPADRIHLHTKTAEDRSEVWSVRPDGTDPRPITSEDAIHGFTSAASGRALYYLSGRAQTVDLRRVDLEPAGGDAAPIVSDLLHGLRARGSRVSVSDDCRRLLLTESIESSNLFVLDREISETDAKQLTRGTLTHGSATFSPDGESVAYSRGAVGRQEVFVHRTGDTSGTQLTFLEADSRGPSWSADGTWISFLSGEGSRTGLWLVPSSGGPVRELPQCSPATDGSSWLPDGRLLCLSPDRRKLEIVDPDTAGSDTLLGEPNGWILAARGSPCGRRIALLWNRTEGEGLWLLELGEGSAQLLCRGRILPRRWSPDGRWIYGVTLDDGRPVRVTSTSGTVEPLLPLFASRTERVEDVSADGNRFVLVRSASQSDAWVIDGFDPFPDTPRD